MTWTPWAILTAACGALFIACIPFMLREHRRRHGGGAGYRAQVLFHAALATMTLGSTWPVRTAVTQAVVVIGCVVALAAWVWFRRATRGKDAAQAR